MKDSRFLNICSSERGAALTLVMIVLVIVAIAGVSSIRDSYLNIKASSYFEDSKLSDDSASRILDSHFKVFGTYDFLAKPGENEGSEEETNRSNFYRVFGAFDSSSEIIALLPTSLPVPAVVGIVTK